MLRISLLESLTPALLMRNEGRNPMVHPHFSFPNAGAWERISIGKRRRANVNIAQGFIEPHLVSQVGALIIAVRFGKTQSL